MLARQQADSSEGGFAKLAPFSFLFSFFFIFFFSFFLFLFFIFYCSIWAPRVGLGIAMGWGS